VSTKPIVDDKKEQVREMFNDIADRYDFLNNLLSLGIYKVWRKELINAAKPIHQGTEILDVATGTGDIALALCKLKPHTIVGIDISEKMVQIGKQKVKQAGLDGCVFLQTGDAEDIHYPDNRFDLVTVAYGVRNFANLERGLREIKRVLKPGGKLLILEFMTPRNTLFSKFYRFYFRNILPTIGGIVSANKQAYSYLPASVQQFPDGEQFLTILQNIGFVNAQCKRLTQGVAGLYAAYKPA
jgi:demethylmenaquinone methyltransferase / 2-methoxy-6-polyprenyl-1,4-benzoquinol methylase